MRDRSRYTPIIIEIPELTRRQMITAIWPSYTNLPNHLPRSAAITTQGMISYFVYHVIQTPFLFVPTHKLQYMFIFKTMLVPPMALAMVIWISVKAGGGDAIFKQPPSVHGSERAWLWLMNMTSITGKQLFNLLLEYRFTLLRWLFDTGGQHF